MKLLKIGRTYANLEHLGTISVRFDMDKQVMSLVAFFVQPVEENNNQIILHAENFDDNTYEDKLSVMDEIHASIATGVLSNSSSVDCDELIGLVQKMRSTPSSDSEYTCLN
ncbi:MAG: hypothetical protein Q8O89_00640 [Nanoarchaeota archaeon]|nr:hypothetical protein [Nanoarchaeota archaeon]